MCVSCCRWGWGDRLSTPQAPRLSLPQRWRHRRRRDCTSGPPSSHCGSALRNASSCPTMCFGSSPSSNLLGMDILCFDKTDTLTQIIMILVSKFPIRDFRARVVVVRTIGFSADSERKEYHDMISFKSKQKARQFGPYVFNYSPFGLGPVITSKMCCLGSDKTTSRLVSPCQMLSEGFWAATHLPLHSPSSLTP